MGVRLQLQKGVRFGRLRYICDAESVQSGGRPRRRAVFICDCGARTTANLDNVRSGTTTSCGCYGAERNSAPGVSLGYATKSHPDHVLYVRWRAMHARCYNINWKHYDRYGGRGIRVASVWHGTKGLQRFVAWARRSGFDPVLELDRRDNDGHYTPANCHWVTRRRNSQNRSTTVIVSHPVTGAQVAFSQVYHERPRRVSYAVAIARYQRGLSWQRVFATRL